MSINGMAMNIITYCCSQSSASKFIIIANFTSSIAITIAFVDGPERWVRNLESEGHDYIAELIVFLDVIHDD